MNKAIEAYFADAAADSRKKMDALRADHREDEAVFERIRGNVYDIFRSVAGVAAKQPGDARAFFEARLTQIPAAWETALRQAEAHGNDRAAHIERIKLETVEAIRRDAAALWDKE